MLILFDIDATLLKTSRAGLLAMGDAGRELFGDGFVEEGVDFAGRLDPLILTELAALNGRLADGPTLLAFRQAYGRALQRRLAVPGIAAALPGVPELLDALAPRADAGEITIGLLTGNFPETGELKIRAAGLRFEQFTVHAWGDDSPHTPPPGTTSRRSR